jgi:hypothetical protein
LAAVIGCGSSGDNVLTQQPAESGGAQPSGAGNGTGTAPTGGTGAQPTGGTRAPAANGGMGAAGARAGQAGAGATSTGSNAAGSSGTAASVQAGTGTAPSAGSDASSAGGAPTAAGSGEAGTAGATNTPGSALTDVQALIPDPSWTCNMPDGIPAPASGELVFEIDFTVSEVRDLGQTQYGHREQIDVSGGTVSGPMLEGTLADRGLDYQLTLDNGVVELEQIHILRAGTSPVYMRNCGLAPSAAGPVRVVLDFEAPNASSVSWLNMGTYIGVREFDAASKAMTMKVYSVSTPADKSNAVQVPAAPEGPHQTWECKKREGAQGSVVYTETVGIGGSVSVGASKRGSRNIIPITGGSTSGMIEGGVLSGGADFQLSANGVFELDARYTLKTSDGELIIVRNCGAIGGLVPVFEANKAGKYAWVNEGDYLSSDPGISVGAVNLTIYEKR